MNKQENTSRGETSSYPSDDCCAIITLQYASLLPRPERLSITIGDSTE